jgi:hypothetical protein
MSENEFLYRFEARITAAPVGIVPEGLRMTVEFDGHVTEGLWKGARVHGIDPLVIRSDGIGVIDAPKTISLEGRSIFEHLRGFCAPPEGMNLPSLDAMLDPDFQWPETPFAIYGASTFATSDPELAHLNSALAHIRGQASFATGKLEVETRLLPTHRVRPQPSAQLEVGAWA